jgi:sirohydrochlorin cobaltochelatase
LVIIAHGDCGGIGGNVLARELARRVGQTGRFAEVAAGFLRCQPSIEEVAAHIASATIRLYPLFLSDGYYVRDAIPRRLAIKDGVDALGHRVIVDEPLGLHPRLPEILASAAAAAALGRGISPNSATLLIVAHGSRHTTNSADIARLISDGIASKGRFRSVDVSFLEEAPFFRDALRRCPRPTFVLGLFAGGGMHATDDVQRAIAALGDNLVFGIEQLGGYGSIIELISSDLSKFA